MKNRGFSMVELIIVIAIMAILAGFLAPSLIRYINKSRLSTDIDTGRNLAMAIMSAVVEDEARDDVKDHPTPQNVKDMDGPDFKAAVSEIFPLKDIQGKSKKDTEGNPFPNQGEFYYTLDQERNRVEVYYGTDDADADYMIYPQTGRKLVE